jgi:hypothetical protein
MSAPGSRRRAADTPHRGSFILGRASYRPSQLSKELGRTGYISAGLRSVYRPRQIAARTPQVIDRPHPQPQVRAIAAKLAQPQRHLRSGVIGAVSAMMRSSCWRWGRPVPFQIISELCGDGVRPHHVGVMVKDLTHDLQPFPIPAQFPQQSCKVQLDFRALGHEMQHLPVAHLGSFKLAHAIEGNSQIVEGLHKGWFNPNGRGIAITAFLKRVALNQDCAQSLPSVGTVRSTSNRKPGRGFGRSRVSATI